MTNSKNAPAMPAVLVVAAHPDDEVLGCGGTIARYAAGGHAVHVLLMADGESSRGPGTLAGAEIEARNSAATKSCEILGCASLQILALPDNRLDSCELLDVVLHVEAAVRKHSPAIVLTHHAGDVNIDHRVVQDAVIAACRPQPGHCVRTLLFFEVPSSTEWRPPASAPPFAPDWFVDITGTLAQKRAALDAYGAELRPFPHARSHQAIEALERWRGASVGVAAAEAFMLGRHIV